MKTVKFESRNRKPEAPDGNIYVRLSRCISMLRRLEQAELHITYLAEQYACTTRTILRDLNVLTMAGHPIMSTGARGVYRLGK